ncbi:MAG: YccF domain-containing protein [Rhodobacteraceae bacterium]|nr:YccF domain-containing protein [Paracoccaceae bacterium]
MNLVLNVIWIVLGGAWMALGWLLAALLMALSIVGLPWARSAVVMAGYTLMPFGMQAMDRSEVSGPDLGTGPMGTLGNLLWLVLAGWWLALGHVLTALVNAVTIIGLPFAWAHLKLAGLALWPVGRTLVPRGMAQRPM